MLGPLDYAVIAAYLAAITAFGSWFARYQHTTRDYFLSGHSVPWWAVCCTVVATETSTLTFIGIPATAYASNMAFLQLALGYVIGRILVSVLFIPAYFRGELVTSYELLQRRFGRRVTTAVGRAVPGDPLARRRHPPVCDRAGHRRRHRGLADVDHAGRRRLMIVYTVRGGAAAVIWTDVVQMFVYVAGAAAVAWQLLAQIPGGWDEVVRTGMAAGKFAIWDLSTDPSTVYTLWTGLFGGVALTLATHGTDQFLVQRLLAATSARAAATGLVLSGVIVFAQFTLFLSIGVMLYTFYQHAPLATPLGRTDEILPTFVVNQLPRGTGRLHRRGDRRRGAVAVAERDGGDDGQRLLQAAAADGPGRGDADAAVAARHDLSGASCSWAIALGAQTMDRSVLDAGLAVLSFASGAVLGAFIIATADARTSTSRTRWPAWASAWRR